LRATLKEMENSFLKLFLNKTDNVRLLQDGVFQDSSPNDADGVILNLLNPENNLKKCLSDLIDVAGSIITENGQIVIAFYNKYNLGNFLVKKDKKQYKGYSLSIIKKLLRAKGYSEFKFYSYSIGEMRIADIDGERFLAPKNLTLSLKDIIRNKLIPNKLLNCFYPSYIVVISRMKAKEMDFFSSVLKEFGLNRRVELIHGKPNSAIIISDKIVIKVPLDKAAEARCRHNKSMLAVLRENMQLLEVPRFIKKCEIQKVPLYVEERKEGSAIDSPVKEMDKLVFLASEFITDLQEKTAREVVVDEKQCKIMLERKLKTIIPFLSQDKKDKLVAIYDAVRGSFIGKSIKTVLTHGDYNIENVLFDMKELRIKGVIDWDLSSKRGLPLLDIFYLLLYKESLVSGRDQFSILIERFSKLNFSNLEDKVIRHYLKRLNIDPGLIRPLLLMFWLNSLRGRYRQVIISNSVIAKNWFEANVNKIIDSIYSDVDLIKVGI
jgi:thiamine kinase-like enzyme